MVTCVGGGGRNGGWEVTWGRRARPHSARRQPQGKEQQCRSTAARKRSCPPSPSPTSCRQPPWCQGTWPSKARAPGPRRRAAPQALPRTTEPHPSRSTMACMCTTAAGFFSTAYTRSRRPASEAAATEARTSGPRPGGSGDRRGLRHGFGTLEPCWRVCWRFGAAARQAPGITLPPAAPRARRTGAHDHERRHVRCRLRFGHLVYERAAHRLLVGRILGHVLGGGSGFDRGRF